MFFRGSKVFESMNSGARLDYIQVLASTISSYRALWPWIGYPPWSCYLFSEIRTESKKKKRTTESYVNVVKTELIQKIP